MLLENNIILVVGASTGIGRAVALNLSHHNNKIAIAARSAEKLQQLAMDIEANGSKALVLQVDALDQAAAAAAVTNTAQYFGGIDAALLNVGDGPAFNMSKVSVDDVTTNMDLNYTTMVNFLIPLIAEMKAKGGGLIAHTNSLAGFLGLPMQGPYSAAKAASRILLDCCRIELKPYNIRFVSTYPGFVATERVAEDGIPAPFEISENIAAKHIIKAMKKEKPDHLFPLVTASLIRLSLILPKPLNNWLLSRSVPKDY